MKSVVIEDLSDGDLCTLIASKSDPLFPFTGILDDIIRKPFRDLNCFVRDSSVGQYDLAGETLPYILSENGQISFKVLFFL